MGTDADAVVDSEGRLNAVSRLRVADASIMPRVITGNLNAPVIMMAEKISDRILGRQPLPPSDGMYHRPRHANRVPHVSGAALNPAGTEPPGGRMMPVGVTAAGARFRVRWVGRGSREHKNIDVISPVLIIALMLMDAARWLRECGLTVEDLTPADGTDAGVDAILELETDDRRVRFAVQVKSRAPYPHELERLKQSWHGLAARGHPLIVTPFISEPLGSALTRDGWSWADAQGNFDLRAPGLLLRQRRSSSPPAPKRKTLPRGSGGFAVVRALVGFSRGEDEEPGATALAAQAGVSQPRASQILHHLHQLELVDRSGHGRWEPRREALLDRFLAEYPGPGGSEQYYYSLDSPLDVAVHAGQVSTPGHLIVASADVGPDLILAWRRPSLVILYAKHAIDPSDLGLTPAQGRHDANVIMRAPRDRSVFPAPVLAAQVHGRDVPLADPLQQIWDLQDLGGADRIEAAGRLRQWLLERP